MRKIKLELETLAVQSFATSTARASGGTVVGHEPTNGHNQQCGSLYDACQTGLCTPNCAGPPTEDPDYCSR